MKHQDDCEAAAFGIRKSLNDKKRGQQWSKQLPRPAAEMHRAQPLHSANREKRTGPVDLYYKWKINKYDGFISKPAHTLSGKYFADQFVEPIKKEMTGRILVTSLWRNVEVYAPPQIDVPLNLQAIAGSWARQSRGCTYMLIVLQMQ